MQRIIPAILTSDPEDLRAKLRLFKGESEWMHIDIMDGKFVPNVSVSVRDLKEVAGDFHLEIHLMVADPAKYFEDCLGIGAKRVIFHREAVQEQEPMLSALDSYEFQKGIALNKATSPELVAAYAKKISSILLMGIEPGAQGRPFDVAVLPKAKKIKEMYPDLVLGIDGGIGKENIQSVFASGADYAVVGSKIFDAQDPKEAFRELQEMIQSTNAS